MNGLKIFKHTGNGHYIGSCVIVVSKNIFDATDKIGDLLTAVGLPNEELNIEEIEITEGVVIELDNGDY